MAQARESRGTCLFCGETIAKRTISKHLAKCPKRMENIQAADASARPEDMLWHLCIQAAHLKEFWLDLEMTGSTSLESLDKYLRAIWLECSGHLSDFTTGEWGGKKIGKANKANSIFEAGLVLRHLYDFGSTTETDIQVVGSRTGRSLTTHPIHLMACNLLFYSILQLGCSQEWL